jgi:hypothetical protein
MKPPRILPRTRPLPRRGVALLIVLGVLIVTLSASAILITSAADARLHRQISDASQLADDLLRAADRPIEHWLNIDASKVVLPPDAATPGVVILHDQWTVPDRTRLELKITAFDQCGMVPMQQLARAGSPLRLALDAQTLEELDSMSGGAFAPETPLGLDMLAAEWVTPADGPPPMAVFPAIPDKGAIALEADPVSGGAPPDHATLGVRALGGLVATHNRDPVRINISTAPLPLVRAAMRAAGQSVDIDAIIDARRHGRSAVTISGTGRAGGASDVPQIVTSSDRWAFRIDVRAGLLRRSWWAVYAPATDRRNYHAWTCVQRLMIND